MRRSLSVAAILLTGVMSYGLYNMKYEVLRLEGKLSGLQHTLVKDRQAVQVLHAEWAYLNRPGRLQRLSNNHLDLQPIQVGQMIDLDELPERPQKSAVNLTDPSRSARSTQ